MRVLADTSVWIDFFNNFKSRESQALTSLIEQEIELATCGVIVAEFMQGIRNLKTLLILENHFKDMEWFTPKEPDTYLSAAVLFRELRAKGVTIRSTIDCLIAQLCVENNALLLSKDHDMKMIIAAGVISVKPMPLSI
jgi:predicted nucleic acid-binding protein